MKKTLKTIRTLFFSLLMVICIGQQCYIYTLEVTVCDHKLPSLTNVQKAVGAVPDGVYGKETRDKWELYLCNQYAKEDIERNLKNDN